MRASLAQQRLQKQAKAKLCVWRKHYQRNRAQAQSVLLARLDAVLNGAAQKIKQKIHDEALDMLFAAAMDGEKLSPDQRAAVREVLTRLRADRELTTSTAFDKARRELRMILEPSFPEEEKPHPRWSKT
jgi:hypothetical protein